MRRYFHLTQYERFLIALFMTGAIATLWIVASMVAVMVHTLFVIVSVGTIVGVFILAAIPQRRTQEAHTHG